jgi:hypothetical protein
MGDWNAILWDLKPFKNALKALTRAGPAPDPRLTSADQR